MLAGYLALVAGFVNSGGFVLIGTFTSHVTGNLGRFSTDLAAGNIGAALSAALLAVMFFVGAFSASLIIEASAFRSIARAYGFALLIESLLLVVFVFVAGLSRATHPRALDAEAAVLCLAMGVQNSLVTRLSGAVVRTTHLTGVVTDLGIEAARWYRWHRAKLRGLPLLLPGRSPPDQPLLGRVLLLSTIAGAFTTGAAIGALTTLRTSRWAMVAPAAAILAASLYAFYDRDRTGSRADPTEEGLRPQARLEG